MHSRFIHIVVCISSSFFYIDEWNSPVDEYLNFFQCLAVINICILWNINFHFTWVSTWVWDCWVVRLTLQETSNILSNVKAHFAFPLATDRSSRCSTSSPTLNIVCLPSPAGLFLKQNKLCQSYNIPG